MIETMKERLTRDFRGNLDMVECIMRYTDPLEAELAEAKARIAELENRFKNDGELLDGLVDQKGKLLKQIAMLREALEKMKNKIQEDSLRIEGEMVVRKEHFWFMEKIEKALQSLDQSEEKHENKET